MKSDDRLDVLQSFKELIAEARPFSFIPGVCTFYSEAAAGRTTTGKLVRLFSLTDLAHHFVKWQTWHVVSVHFLETTIKLFTLRIRQHQIVRLVCQAIPKLFNQRQSLIGTEIVNVDVRSSHAR